MVIAYTLVTTYRIPGQGNGAESDLDRTATKASKVIRTASGAARIVNVFPKP